MKLGVAFSVAAPASTIDEDLVQIGTLGSRPAASSAQAGRQFFATDTGIVYVCVPAGLGYAWTAVGPKPSWRTTPDSHDLGVWRMDETAGPFANAGEDGTLDLASNGSIAYRDTGPLGTGVYLDGVPSSHARSADTTLCQPAAITVWSWIRVRKETSGWPVAIAKVHSHVGDEFVAPFFDWVIQVSPSGNGGRWLVGANIGGTLQTVDVSSDSQGSIVVDRPHLLAMTYDGTTLKAYRDDALVGSAVHAGAIDYNGGGIIRGGGGTLNSSAYALDGWLGEARVRDAVLTQAQIAEIYQRHIGVFGS